MKVFNPIRPTVNREKSLFMGHKFVFLAHEN